MKRLNLENDILVCSFNLKFPGGFIFAYPWLRERVRYYKITPERVGAGVFGNTYKGFPCYSNGERYIDPKTKKPCMDIVAKCARIPSWMKDESQEVIKSRLHEIGLKGTREFELISQRLDKCGLAIPTIDYTYHRIGNHSHLVTIQPFVQSASRLDDWLKRIGLRKYPAERTSGGRLSGANWHGIQDRKTWSHLGLQIALAIEETHRHRVVHADIHPGNIMIGHEQEPIAKLIDFGEAFPATPGENWKLRKVAKPYWAPERTGPRVSLDEQVDIYSFGILMLYLASGKEVTFKRDGELSRHRRVIQDIIRKVNPELLTEEPRILDLIGRCTALDPMDRPKIAYIVDDLKSIASACSGRAAATSGKMRSASNPFDHVKKQFNAISRKASGRHNPVLIRLIERKLVDLSMTLDGLKTEMLELTGLRDDVLRYLIYLFDCLQRGDSWSTVTTLSLWQHNALGMNGSYMSSNIRALKRGASIRRTFLMSAEELGIEATAKLTRLLSREKNGELQKLGVLFLQSIDRIDKAKRVEICKPAQLEEQAWHRLRFTLMCEYLKDAVEMWDLKPSIREASGAGIDLVNLKGFFVGICPLSTKEDCQAMREANPGSLMYQAHQKIRKNRWLLVLTEAKRRIANSAQAVNLPAKNHHNSKHREWPHLIGVKVYTSFFGRPDARIGCMTELMRDKTVNIAPHVHALYPLLKRAFDLPRA